MILGLDISTAIVGVALIEERELILSEHWDISKTDTLLATKRPRRRACLY